MPVPLLNPHVLDERFAEMAPLAAEPWISVEACAGCHETPTEEWRGSAHAAAWTAPVFQAGYLAEPQAWCVGCHAPNPAQMAEIDANAGARALLAPFAPVPDTPVRLLPEPRAAEGINCATCHVRRGTVLAEEVGGYADHPALAVPGFGSAAECRTCHEFDTPVFSSTGVTFSDLPMQSTWSEWQEYARLGGEGSCIDCHMSGGSHRFPGAGDPEFLRAAASIAVSRTGDEVEWAIRSVGVGHRLPTGDLFRHLTLEVTSDGERWTTIDWIGRRFATDVSADGATVRRLLSDTSLVPGEVRRVRAFAGTSTRWRLVYHYASEIDEVRGLLPLDTLRLLLATDAIPAR